MLVLKYKYVQSNVLKNEYIQSNVLKNEYIQLNVLKYNYLQSDAITLTSCCNQNNIKKETNQKKEFNSNLIS